MSLYTFSDFYADICIVAHKALHAKVADFNSEADNVAADAEVVIAAIVTAQVNRDALLSALRGLLDCYIESTGDKGSPAVLNARAAIDKATAKS